MAAAEAAAVVVVVAAAAVAAAAKMMNLMRHSAFRWRMGSMQCWMHALKIVV